MKTYLLMGMLAVGMFAAMPTVSAHNHDCLATSHTLIDAHLECTGTTDKPEYREWCVVSVDYGATHVKLLCDAGNQNGNPFH